MVFKISKEKTQKYLIRPILLLVLYSFIVSFLFQKFNDGDFKMFLEIFFLLFFAQSFLTTLPLIVLFINYRINDKMVNLKIFEDKDKFEYIKNGLKISFNKEDIKRVTCFITPQKFDNGMTWFYWDDLFYYEILLEENIIRISCLTIDDLEKYIPKNRFSLNKKIYPVIT